MIGQRLARTKGRFAPQFIPADNTAGTTIFSRTYDFHKSNGDNGNVFQIANGLDSNRTQNFLYDRLNRISQAYTTGTNWGETYGPTATAPGTQPTTAGIDPWGNLINRSPVIGKTMYEPLSAGPATHNRLTGFGYDAAGNMISNGSATYMYDAENRVINTAGHTYIYDGEGRRVEKCITPNQSNPASCAGAPAGNGTLYWVDNSVGSAESDLGFNWTAVYARRNGKLMARIDFPANTANYYFTDMLGTAEVISNGSGSVTEDCDYYPYGGQENCPTNLDTINHYKFTGKERDAESGLDNFGARYNASTMGRFMTPDWAAKPTTVPYAEFGDPQSLNLYSYVRNNPLSRRDADGHEVDLTGTDKDKLEEQKRITANASKKGESKLFKTVTDKNGKTKLVVDKEAAANFKGQHSAGYNLLTGAINAKPTITVEMSDMDSETKAPDSKGNVTVNLDRKESAIDQISPLRGYDGKKISNPFQIIAGHEVLGHAYPVIMGWDNSETNARAVENELRGEQGLPLRDPNSN